MKILVSHCLLGQNCKYNGGNNFMEEIAALAAEHELIPICPEVLGGLPTPRVPSEITGEGRVVTRDGSDVDREFRLGAEKSLEIALREKPDLCILKGRSPSCGVREHYDGTFTGTIISGSGITAELFKKHGFVCIDAEDYLSKKRRNQEGFDGSMGNVK